MAPEVDPIFSIPPRLHWTKRIMKGLLVLLALLAAIRWGWGLYADHQLKHTIARCQRPDVPFYPADFKRAPLADSQNAAIILANAAGSIKTTYGPSQLDNSVLPFSSRSPAADIAVARSYVNANTNALAALRQVRGMHADWDYDIGAGFRTLFTQPLPTSQQRALASLARYAAVLAHIDGDDRECHQYWLDLFNHAEVQRPLPLLIGALIAEGIDSMACQLILDLAPDLRIDGPRGVPRRDVEALVRQLLDESSIRESYVRAFAAERWFNHEMFSSLADGQVSFTTVMSVPQRPTSIERALVWTVSPGLRTQAASNVQYHSRVIESFAAPNFPQSAAIWPPDELITPARIVPADEFNRIGLYTRSTYRNAIIRYWKMRTQRRAAATALAIRLYRLDHHDAFPDSLESLVPNYLPALPIDPFDPAGKPLRYTSKFGRPILYSLGENGLDDLAQGTFKLPARDDQEPRKPLDFVFELTPP